MSSCREQAAFWFTRLLHLPSDHPDHAAFQAWLDASPRHASEYQAFSELWGDFSSTSKTQALATSMEHAGARRSSRRVFVRNGLLGLAGVLALGMGGRYWSRYGRFEQRYFTAKGERTHHWLPDGSELFLNAGTRLLVRYDGQRRQIFLLEGEAIFDVAKAPLRPFMIEAGLAMVTVLGTRFVVSRLEDRVRVSVEHGRVQVDTEGARLVLGHNEVAEVRRDLALQRLSIAASNAFAFEHGAVAFEKADLGEIAASLSRYSQSPIRSVPGKASPRVTAVVQVGDVDSFLRALPDIAAVEVQHRAGAIWLRAR